LSPKKKFEEYLYEKDKILFDKLASSGLPNFKEIE
jgi:hypothetical protein